MDPKMPVRQKKEKKETGKVSKILLRNFPACLRPDFTGDVQESSPGEVETGFRSRTMEEVKDELLDVPKKMRDALEKIDGHTIEEVIELIHDNATATLQITPMSLGSAALNYGKLREYHVVVASEDMQNIVKTLREAGIDVEASGGRGKPGYSVFSNFRRIKEVDMVKILQIEAADPEEKPMAEDPLTGEVWDRHARAENDPSREDFYEEVFIRIRDAFNPGEWVEIQEGGTIDESKCKNIIDMAAAVGKPVT